MFDNQMDLQIILQISHNLATSPLGTSSPQQVIDSVINGNPSWGVFDMHGKQVTLDALLIIIETFQKRGLHFVVLGEVADYSYVSMP